MALSSHTPAHILVVDDDARIRQMLTRYFEGEGYSVSTATDGAEIETCLKRLEIDIILLDLALPGGKDGIDIVREIRSRSDIPIMMITGRTDVIDRIIGIEIGADDYIAKPFHLREVHARLKSILRRRKPPEVNAPARDRIRFEGWVLDLAGRQLQSPDGENVELTSGEFDMLQAFVQHAGRVLTRDFLMDSTRARPLESFDRTIDAQISRLRRKIEADTKLPRLIKTVRGAGYMFAAKID